MELSDEVLEGIRKNLSDREWRLENLYWIKDKNGKKVPFKMNWAQRKFHESRHNRNIILKARQLGFTTYKCIERLDYVLWNPYVDAGIIAHSIEDAEKIFSNKVKFAFDNLPEIIKTTLKPNTDRAGELRFPNGSSISVSAGYRGGTLAGGLHVSEYGKICSKYPEKAREVKSGALNAVPLGGDADFESTAEGMSGDFFEMYEKAQNHSGELTQLDFRPHFFSWWQASEYRLNPYGVEISKELKDYFDYLEKDHGIKLDEHQKAWYAKKSEEQDEDMQREYPSYPVEAFMASGRPVFNQQKIARDLRRAKDKEHEIVRFDVRGRSFPVKIYKKPVKDMAYAVGADVAEGLEDGDSSTLSVIDRNFEQCASFCGSLEPADHGRLLVAVGKYYHNALLAPEQNNHGHATLAAIKDEKYYKVFKREVLDELGKDILEKVGWLTTVKSKMKMIDDLKEAYRDDSTTINDEATLREMLSIKIEDDGDIVLNGKDRTVAHAIAIQAIKQASVDGEHKAYVPTSIKKKDVTLMTASEKIAYYKRRQRE